MFWKGAEMGTEDDALRRREPLRPKQPGNGENYWGWAEVEWVAWGRATLERP